MEYTLSQFPCQVSWFTFSFLCWANYNVMIFLYDSLLLLLLYYLYIVCIFPVCRLWWSGECCVWDG